MVKRLRFPGVALLLAGVLSFIGAGGSAVAVQAATTRPSGTLNVCINAYPPNLDPSASTALVDRYVQYSIFDRLYNLNAKLQIVPMLAASLPKITDGGKVYTIQLRKGIKFQDGTPFNAQAVVFNLERYMNPSSARASEVSSIQTVQATGPYTVKLTLKAPYSPLTSMFTDRSGMIGSPTAIKREGANFGNHPVGTGPFEYVSAVKGSTITLKANPHYWQKGEPKVAEVVYHAITDPNVEVANLQSGQCDIIDSVPAQDVKPLSGGATRVYATAGIGFQGFFLNVKAAPFDNVWLRRAVSAAINRKALVQTVFPGVAEAGNGPFAPSTPAASASGPVPGPNLKAARADLNAGGHPGGFSFTFKTATGPITQEVASVLQAQLAQVGIQMTIQQEDFGTLLNDCSTQAYQACALGWSGRADPDGDIYSWFYTGAALNDSGYSNATVDNDLNQARALSNMAQRVREYTIIMTTIHNQAPYVFLYFPKNVMAARSIVKGFVNYPDGIIRVASVSK